MNEGLVNLIKDAELASDTGRERESLALTYQMFPTTLCALPKMYCLVSRTVLIHVGGNKSFKPLSYPTWPCISLPKRSLLAIVGDPVTRGCRSLRSAERTLVVPFARTASTPESRILCGWP